MGDDQIGKYISRSVLRCGLYWSSRLGFCNCLEVWAIMQVSSRFLHLFRVVGDIGGLASVCYDVYVALQMSSIAAMVQAVAVGTYGPKMVSLLSAAPRQMCVDVAAAEAVAAVELPTWNVVATREHRDSL